MKLAGRDLGDGAPCFVIAEAGVNHNGDVDTARALVRAAAGAGADAVKFQLFRADEIASESAPKAGYQLETTSRAESQHAMLRALELPLEAFVELKRAADDEGIAFLCTCYAESDLDFLDELGVPAFKFASAQIVELPLLAHAAGKSKPILLPAGMATLDEIADAVARISTAGNPDVILLQCTTSYPAAAEDANLRTIPALAQQFGTPVGYSDHTIGSTAAVVAAACGAAVVEKHLTLDRAMPGPDHRSSLEPNELAALIMLVRETELLLGSSVKAPTATELANAPLMRRSLFAGVDIPAGTTLARDLIALRRPAVGLAPRFLDDIVGATAQLDIPNGTPLTLEFFGR